MKFLEIWFVGGSQQKEIQKRIDFQFWHFLGYFGPKSSQILPKKRSKLSNPYLTVEVVVFNSINLDYSLKHTQKMFFFA